MSRLLLCVDFVSWKMRSQSIVVTMACNIRMCDQATLRVSDSTVKATLPSWSWHRVPRLVRHAIPSLMPRSTVHYFICIIVPTLTHHSKWIVSNLKFMCVKVFCEKYFFSRFKTIYDHDILYRVIIVNEILLSLNYARLKLYSII